MFYQITNQSGNDRLGFENGQDGDKWWNSLAVKHEAWINSPA